MQGDALAGRVVAVRARERQGALIDRIQVPKDRTVVGFGTGGIVYLAVREGTTTKLEKAKIR